MTYKMHPKQLENVFALDSKDRFEHFVLKVCDWEEVWILENTEEDFLILCPEPELKYIPVWPHADYASSFAKEHYPDYKPSKISISSFIESWLPGLNEDSIKVGVLPNLVTTVWITEPFDLKEELELQLQEYE